MQVEVDGSTVPLSPRALRVLARLIAAQGRAVGVRQLRWDLWQEIDLPHDGRNGRNQVQKGVSELRKVLDPERSGTAAELLRTERSLSGRDIESSYRLVLGPDTFDAAEFGALIGAALRGTAASAAEKLSRAVALWRGRPLTEAGSEDYAKGLIDAWQAQYRLALRELIRLHGELGRLDLALEVAERSAAEFPDDADAAAELAAVRGRLRERHGDYILREDFPDLNTSVVIVRGDLFEQHDAHLVIGFTDTFDTDIRQDVVINRNSMQGQLLQRLYHGDTAALDRDLRRALRTVTPAGRETSSTKSRGKLIRYPLGTVVPLPVDGRRVFAAAYSRLGNDLVARARAEDIEAAFERLWAVAALSGQLAPIAVPLVGSGLSRQVDLTPEEVIGALVESFVKGCREHVSVTTQLRIVLKPGDLERMDMSRIVRAVTALAA
jgi:hypothetical protein